jgi:hypothetical protein
MFSITDEPPGHPYGDAGIGAAPGRLVMGESTEDFLANLSLWSKSDYESHWTRELTMLVEGNLKAALVVSFDDPKAASNMEIWRVYRGGATVYLQNQLLWFKSLPREFDISDIGRLIDDRSVVTAEGNRISEWSVAVRDVEMFLKRSNPL